MATENASTDEYTRLFKDKTREETLEILFPGGVTPENIELNKQETIREYNAIINTGPLNDHLNKKNELPQVSERVRPHFIKDIGQMGEETFQFHQQIKERQLLIGIDFIDKATRGIGPGEVMLILARTKVGKTLLGQNILRHMNRAGQLTLFMSLEMTTPIVYERWVQMEEKMSSDEFEYTFQKEPSEARAIIESMKDKLPFCRIVDRAGLTLRDIEDYITIAEEWSMGIKVKCVLIDYLGLIDWQDKYSSTYDRISLIAKGVCAMAKRKDLGVILIHQTSRAGGRGDERVTFNMARDSGVIEEAVDMVVTAWRPKVGGHDKITLCLDLNRKGEMNIEKTLDFNPRTLEITDPDKKTFQANTSIEKADDEELPF